MIKRTKISLRPFSKRVKLAVNCDMTLTSSHALNPRRGRKKSWIHVRLYRHLLWITLTKKPFFAAVGIVRLTIHQAKELDHTKSLSGDLNPLARVYLNGTKSSAFSTRCFKHTNTPVWEAPYEYLCTDKQRATVTVKVIDDRDFLKDPVIGYMSIKLEDLLHEKLEAGRDWFPLSGCKTGKVRISAEWKPLAMAGSLHGMDQYTPPIGVVKLVLDKAVDVKYMVLIIGPCYKV